MLVDKLILVSRQIKILFYQRKECQSPKTQSIWVTVILLMTKTTIVMKRMMDRISDGTASSLRAGRRSVQHDSIIGIGLYEAFMRELPLVARMTF